MSNIINKFKNHLADNKERKLKEREEYEKRVINYNRVVAVELANRRKPKKAPEGSFISLQNINKIYDNLVQAVFDFNLDIKKNEFVVFVGPSGCGKSTTLRMIAGLEEITAGNLFIDGVYANSLAPKDRNIAMVFQSYALYPHMSVFDNMAFSMKIRPTECPILDENGNPKLGIDEEKLQKLEKSKESKNNDLNKLKEKESSFANILEETKAKFGAEESKDAKENIYNARDNLLSVQYEIKKLENEINELDEQIEKVKNTQIVLAEYRKLNKDEIKKNVLEAAKILQIDEYLDRKPKALSGGQRQRVALGRAICKKAKLFLMDEPLSNLDAKLRVSMRSEIIRLHKAIGATTIYVTHDQTEAMTMADRIVIMEKGVVQQIGTPREIYNHPANVFVATFIGSPSMNILKVQIKDGRIKFDENNYLELPKEIIDKLVAKLEERVAKINDFIKNGVQEEYEKELNVKRETLRIKLDTKGYKFSHDENGNVLDPIESLTLNEEEKAVCESFYKEKLKRLLTFKDSYEKMLKEGVYEVIFGVRPEDVYFKDNITERFVKESNELTLTISIPELLGHEYFLHAELGKKDFVFKTSANYDVKENSNVKVIVDLNKIHLFDTIDKNILV